jgi:hypothetical protein
MDIHNPSRFVLLGSAAAYGREIIPERVIKWAQLLNGFAASHPEELE